MYKTNQPAFLFLFFFVLPKVLAFFISDAQHPQRCNMKGNTKCCQDGVLCAICVNPTRCSVFTERSIPKLWGLTLSKMNNLFIVTLNLLSCNNCFCNILPDVFFSPSSRHDWNQSRAACLFHGDKNVSLMTLTFSCFQMVERQLAQLLLVNPNFFDNFDGRNFTFQIKILHLNRQYCSSPCLNSPIACSSGFSKASSSAQALFYTALFKFLHKC